MKNQPGVADHAPVRKRWWDSRPFRTAIQGLATDVGIAVAFLIYDTLQAETVNWMWLLGAIGKTALMTGASWLMRRLKPPSPQ